MKTADALAECLRNLATGEDLQECLSRFPGKEHELLEALSVWQLLVESTNELPAHLRVSREAFYLQISRERARGGLPVAMKFALVAAIGSFVSLVVFPETAYGLMLSLSGSVAWLSWWLLSFMPRLFSLKARSESLSA